MIIKESNLGTRSFARSMFKELLKKKDFLIDFRNVEVASRSFTNELITLEKKNNIKIKKINMNNDVKFMFNIADKKLDTDILSKNKYKVMSIKKLLKEI